MRDDPKERLGRRLHDKAKPAEYKLWQTTLTLKVFLSNVMSTNPMISQMTHVEIEISTTVGTKYADNLSANFWIGACKRLNNFKDYQRLSKIIKGEIYMRYSTL